LRLSDIRQIVDSETTLIGNKFSLAGVQMKFSMREQDGRFNLTQATSSDDSALDSKSLGDWIIKTPSTRHAYVPLNEYTAMMLAKMVGVDIPEIKLVDMSQLDNLPPINLPQEQYAFAIKRFDRLVSAHGVDRVHMEDFAQVLSKYPHEKYNSANYEQIGRVLYQFSGDAISDIQQFARRLLVNILLANGDAHLKNWSLLYRDQVTPVLSPAYDILTTSVYIQGERHFALNLAKNKDWYLVEMSHFQQWAEKAGVPWRMIKPHLDDVMDKARTLWSSALNDLPMIAEHQVQLRAHWQLLSPDFRI
jgi:serine/threonine-protein kinase HipA